MAMMRGAGTGQLNNRSAYLGGDWFSRRGPAGTGRSLFMGKRAARDDGRASGEALQCVREFWMEVK